MRDVTRSARGLFHTPGHSVAVVLTLALGIGATTMIFSVVHSVLIKPLPFPDQERIAMLWQRAPGVGVARDWFSPAQYFDLREVSSFEEVAIFVAPTGGQPFVIMRAPVTFASAGTIDTDGLTVRTVPADQDVTIEARLPSADRLRVVFRISGGATTIVSFDHEAPL